MFMQLAACEAGAIRFIEQYFHDCIYNLRDLGGFTCGTVSIALWVCAQLPQVRVQPAVL